jgi:hypothetical protein
MCPSSIARFLLRQPSKNFHDQIPEGKLGGRTSISTRSRIHRTAMASNGMMMDYTRNRRKHPDIDGQVVLRYTSTVSIDLIQSDFTTNKLHARYLNTAPIVRKVFIGLQNTI